MSESGSRNTALTLSSEREAATSSGYVMLLVMLVALIVGFMARRKSRPRRGWAGR